jgi:hypothetical protein
MEEAAKVYLRDPDLALDQLRSVVDLAAVKSFIMSRGFTEESWGEALWQEVVLTDGHRLLMWRADDEMSTAGERERRVLNASVRTILLSTITGSRRCACGCTPNSSRGPGRSRRPKPTSTASRSVTSNRSTTADWPRCSA